MNTDRDINKLCAGVEEFGEKILSEYLKNVDAYCSWEKVNGQDPDEVLMRSIEERIGISETAKKCFREEILIRISTYRRRGKKFDYHAHERLREAIEKEVFERIRQGFTWRRDVQKLTQMVECLLTNLRNGDVEIAKASICDISRFAEHLDPHREQAESITD